MVYHAMNSIVKYAVLACVSLGGAFALVALITNDPRSSLDIVLRFPFFLFLPGFLWSFVIVHRNGFSGIERVVFAFLFSLVIPPLLFFFLTRFGMAITPTTITAVTSGILILAAGAIAIKAIISSPREKQKYSSFNFIKKGKT